MSQRFRRWVWTRTSI
uniref:Uncharacterized protein n=1 Tax=Arundo donax TaxID=35708 RepID=A0A0A8Y2I5_ARUDO